MHSAEEAGPGPGRQVWNFARHFIEMCVAMCIGGSVLLAAFFWVAAQGGQPDIRNRAPELAVLATAVFYALPMAAWMLFRGMELRPTAEMAAATIAVGVGLVGLTWVGALARADLSGWADASLCLPACAVMLPLMLGRRDMYSGVAGHHMAHAVQAA
jgi:hypothetical protein